MNNSTSTISKIIWSIYHCLFGENLQGINKLVFANELQRLSKRDHFENLNKMQKQTSQA